MIRFSRKQIPWKCMKYLAKHWSQVLLNTSDHPLSKAINNNILPYHFNWQVHRLQVILSTDDNKLFQESNLTVWQLTNKAPITSCWSICQRHLVNERLFRQCEAWWESIPSVFWTSNLHTRLLLHHTPYHSKLNKNSIYEGHSNFFWNDLACSPATLRSLLFQKLEFKYKWHHTPVEILLQMQLLKQ